MRRNAYPSIDRRFVLDAAASTLSFEVMFLFFFLLFKLGEVSWEFFFFFDLGKRNLFSLFEYLFFDSLVSSSFFSLLEELLERGVD